MSARNRLIAYTIATPRELPGALALYDSFAALYPSREFRLYLVSDKELGLGESRSTPKTLKIIRVSELSERDLPNFASFVFAHSPEALPKKLRPMVARALLAEESVAAAVFVAPGMHIAAQSSLFDSTPADYSIIAGEMPEREGALKSGLTPWLSTALERSPYLRIEQGPESEELLNWWAALALSSPALMKHSSFATPPDSIFPQLCLETLKQRCVSLRLSSSLASVGTSTRSEFLLFAELDLIAPKIKDAPRALQSHIELYLSRILGHGILDRRDHAHPYSTFEDGSPIPEIARKIYAQNSEARSRFPNPFQTEGYCFLDWMLDSPPEARGREKLSPLFRRMWSERPDVQAAFPKPWDKWQAFLGWAVVNGSREFGFPSGFHKALIEKQAASKTNELDIGVNLFGYFGSATGMGAASRCDVQCIRAAKIPFRMERPLNDVAAFQTENAVSTGARKAPYKINLLHVNASSLPEVIRDKGKKFFSDKYTIASCVWELERMHPVDSSVFQAISEIWTPSTFSQNALAKISPTPVIRIPHSLPDDFADKIRPLSRAELGWGEKEFVFLFTFNFCSFFERKNPMGLIRAFQKAFTPKDRARLVIKTIGGAYFPKLLAQLKTAETQGKAAPIEIIDEVWSADKTHRLMKTADAYVSLHRSEGFGLTMLEAMALGKPVIATSYSGNLDFMTPFNSYLVPYDLVEIAEDIGPYRAGERWADPSIEETAKILRRVYENRDEARAVGAKAHEDVTRQFSTSAVSELYKDRLLSIASWKI